MLPSQQSIAICFPFDLFGGNGTALGATLLMDALEEMIQDAQSETRPARADCYRDHLFFEEWSFKTEKDYQHWRQEGATFLKEVLENQKTLFWLSGNHLGVLPVYDTLEADDLILQFDAHLDLFSFHDCEETLSHGNFLLHAQKPLPKIINIGHRDLFLKSESIDAIYTKTLVAWELDIDTQKTLKSIQKAISEARRVWIDIDCDFFDPAYFPATPHPVPFGVSPRWLLQFFSQIWSPKVVGVSLSEFDPGRDSQDQSLSTLIWLLEWLLLKWWTKPSTSKTKTRK